VESLLRPALPRIDAVTLISFKVFSRGAPPSGAGWCSTRDSTELGEEVVQFARRPYDKDLGQWRPSRDCPRVRGKASTSPSDQPEPEIDPLPGSQQRSPSAPQKREVENDDGVRYLEAYVELVIRPEITVHDPLFARDQALLQGSPFLGRSGA
jgi:hypothetical protein